MPVDEIEAERPPVAEGGRIHAICDACAVFVNSEDVKFDRDVRGDTCCWSSHFPMSECEADSRGKYVEEPHEAVHALWIH